MFVRTEVEREQTPDGSFYADDSIRVVCVTLFNYYTQTQHAQPNANKKNNLATSLKLGGTTPPIFTAPARSDS